MVPGFVALGASSLLAPMPDPVIARLSRLAGITTIAAGLIPVSRARCPRPFIDPDATASDVGHGVASVATFALWTAMPIVASVRAEPSTFRSASRVGAIAIAVGFLAAGSTASADSENKGLVQRGFLAAVFSWLAIAAATAS